MKKAFNRISKGPKSSENKTDEDNTSIKSYDASLNKTLSSISKKKEEEVYYQKDRKYDTLDKAITNKSFQTSTEYNKDSLSEVSEHPKNRSFIKLHSLMKPADFFKFAKNKLGKSGPKTHETKNKKSISVRINSAKDPSDTKLDDLYPTANTNRFVSDVGEIPIEKSELSSSNDMSIGTKGSNQDSLSVTSNIPNDTSPRPDRMSELYEQIDIRLKELEEHFYEFTQLVQQEVEQINERTNKDRECFELIQYRNDERFGVLEDNLNLCMNKTKCIESQQAQQGAALDNFDAYFGDLERKWGSPILRSVIPVLIFLLIAARTIWKFVGHRHFLIPGGILFGLWILKKFIFG